MGRRVKLHRGTHTRPDGTTVRPGDTFVPSQEDEAAGLDRRVTMAGSVFAPIGDEAHERIFGSDDEEE